MNRPSPRPKLREQQANAQIEQGDFEEAMSKAIVPAGMTPGITAESRSLVIQLQESEFQAQLNFAKQYPRDINRAMERMIQMATWNEEFAALMEYAVPRGGKILRGPTIRFAETIKGAWPHGDSDAFVLFINRDEKFIAVRGFYFDFETNNRSRATVYRSIQDKYGKIFKDDMINVTCNAACAIAERNAILKGIPRPLWLFVLDAARKKAAGSPEGLTRKRQEVLAHFMRSGVAPDRVLHAIGVRSEAQITAEHIGTLRGMWAAVQSGDSSIEEIFEPVKDPAAEGESPTHDAHGNKRHPGAMPQRKTLADLADDAAEAEAEAISDTALAATPEPAQKAPKKPKPLHDVKGGEDEHLGSIHRDVANAEAREQAGIKEPDAAKEARTRLVAKAREDGRLGFHKGLTKVPPRYAGDAELAAAWTEEFNATQREAAAAIEADDELTEGADFMNEGEDDRERYSEKE